MLGGILGILGGLFAAKSGGDLYAKMQGYGNLDQLLGMEATPEQLAVVSRATAEAQKREFSRGVRQQGIDALRASANAAINDRSMEAMQAEIAMGAMARGSDIANVVPTGMRPGALLNAMRANEVDAWKKLRDFRPYEPNANLPEQVQTLGMAVRPGQYSMGQAPQPGRLGTAPQG